jgi:hypothetical protein
MLYVHLCTMIIYVLLCTIFTHALFLEIVISMDGVADNFFGKGTSY